MTNYFIKKISEEFLFCSHSSNDERMMRNDKRTRPSQQIYHVTQHFFKHKTTNFSFGDFGTRLFSLCVCSR